MSAPSPTSVEVGQTLWVLVYEHKYGLGVTAYTTEQAAQKALQGIAAEFWDDEMPEDLPRPEDPCEMADAYFEEMGQHGEFAYIEMTTLQGAS